MYTIFKGFAKIAEVASRKAVKEVLATLSDGAVNVRRNGKAVYSAYHFEAGEQAYGWA